MSENKFTRSNIKKIIQSGANLDPRKSNELTGVIVKAMAAALAAGETIELRGFGSMEVKEYKAGRRRNPQNGEAVIVPPRRRVIFHPGRELKKAFRGKPGAAPD
jgi:integration host factor subunit beta